MPSPVVLQKGSLRPESGWSLPAVEAGLDVEVLDRGGVLLDEEAAGFDFVAHQGAEDRVGFADKQRARPVPRPGSHSAVVRLLLLDLLEAFGYFEVRGRDFRGRD
jgi:hypothetical protein